MLQDKELRSLYHAVLSDPDTAKYGVIRIRDRRGHVYKFMPMHLGAPSGGDGGAGGKRGAKKRRDGERPGQSVERDEGAAGNENGERRGEQEHDPEQPPPGVTYIQWKDVVREIIIKSFGLSRCADTIVGDDAHRGVSGGERKRVTCAEMLAGNRHCLLLDEISTGLDSATTFDICQFLRGVVHDW